jgi:hypothetical protein
MTTSTPPVEPGESWLPVVDYEEFYSVSSRGRIFSHRGAGRVLHPAKGRRIVLAGGRACSVGELLLEARGEPRPAGSGWIAFSADSDNAYRWITRTELLRHLREARAAKRATEEAVPRSPQAEVEEYDVEAGPPSPPTKPARSKKPSGQPEVMELVSSS